MKIEQKDLAYYKAFKKVLDQSKVEFKLDAVKAAASLLIWFDGLEQRMEQSLKKEPPKELKEPINEL